MSAPCRSLCAALLLHGFAVMAQQPAPAAATPQPCSAPQHRQFDYWIGEWDVHDPSGKRVGENRITRIHNGCALLEEWRGNGGVTGSSLNVFDRDREPLAPDVGRQHRRAADARGRSRRRRDVAARRERRSRATAQAHVAAHPLATAIRRPRPSALGSVVGRGQDVDDCVRRLVLAEKVMEHPPASPAPVAERLDRTHRPARTNASRSVGSGASSSCRSLRSSASRPATITCWSTPIALIRHRETLTDLCARLPAGTMLRVHRSHAISIAAVRE